jgi:hypothetical protein
MKMTVVWGITSYIHGDVLTIRVLFLTICLAYGVYFLSQLSEKGYRFLLGLFFKKLGLKEDLVRQQSEMGSKIGIRISL